MIQCTEGRVALHNTHQIGTIQKRKLFHLLNPSCFLDCLLSLEYSKMTFTASNLAKHYQAALLLSAKNKPETEVSQVFCTSDKYEVRLDIQQFSPEEISVKAVGRCIMVEGKHEQKGEILGLISHQFTRRYVLPEGVEPEEVNCSLGSNGILHLSAPRRLKTQEAKEVKIPIAKQFDSEATVTDVTSPQVEKKPIKSILKKSAEP